MKTQTTHTPYYIPIFFETNSYSAEKLVGGILFFCGQEIVFRYAEHKIQASVKLGNIGSATLIRETMENLAQKIQSQKELFNPHYLDYLHRYSNGLIQFGQAKRIVISLADFDSFASKFLGEKTNLMKVVYQELEKILKDEQSSILGGFLEQATQKKYKVVYQKQDKTKVLQAINLENTFETARRNLRNYAQIIRDFPDKTTQFALLTQEPQAEYQQQLIRDFKQQNSHCQLLTLADLEFYIKKI